MRLSARFRFSESLRRKKSGERRKPAPRRANSLSCQTVLSAGASGGWMSESKGLDGMYVDCVEFNLRPLPSSPLSKPVRKAG